MSPEIIAALGPYIAPVIIAVTGVLALWVRDRARSSATQKDLQQWAQSIVHDAVAAERETYAKTMATMREEIERLSKALDESESRERSYERRVEDLERMTAEFPDVIEEFVVVVAGIDREKTPSREQMAALHAFTKRLRLNPRVPNHVLLAKAGS